MGGFDPDCLVEDYELIHRLKRHGALGGRGWTTAVLGSARARTEAPATLGAFLRQRRRWFGGFLQTQSWYRDMIGNPRYGRLGLAMLPVKAADTLQPIYGLTAAALLIDDVVTGRWATAFAGVDRDRRQDRPRPRLPPLVGVAVPALARRARPARACPRRCW